MYLFEKPHVLSREVCIRKGTKTKRDRRCLSLGGMFSEDYEEILRAAAKQICDYVKYRYAHPQTGVSITGSLYSMARACLDDIFSF